MCNPSKEFPVGVKKYVRGISISPIMGDEFSSVSSLRPHPGPPFVHSLGWRFLKESFGRLLVFTFDSLIDVFSCLIRVNAPNDPGTTQDPTKTYGQVGHVLEEGDVFEK